MPPEVEAAIITGVFAVIPLVLGLVFRRRSKSAVIMRRSLNRQEELENYVFTLRRQILAADKRPHPWPARLAYLNRDDQDRQVDDELT